MTDRRLFLKSIGVTALAPLIAGLDRTRALAAPAQPGTGQIQAGQIQAGMVRALPRDLFLVNGWVLTPADLAALGLHAV